MPPTGHPSESASSRKGSERKRARALARTRALVSYDRSLGSPRVAGADEAGRGCLAGPLVAAAVLIDYSGLSRTARRALGGLDDSKRIEPEERERLYRAVLGAATRVSVVVRCSEGLDRRGLHVTNLGALAEALENLEPEGAVCLVDGFAVPECRLEHRAVVKGDSTSAAVAAASVVAKVTRDRHMRRIALEHPGWGFEDHVGYATETHRQAISRLGVSPVHRLSFNSTAYEGIRRPVSPPERALDVI